MARTVLCRSPPVEGKSDTIKPVSPSEELIRESLSQSGETEIVKDQGIAGDREIQALGSGMPTGSPKEDERAEVDDNTTSEVVTDDGGETEDEEGVKEARVAISRKSPKDPTRKEKEEHELTHMPFRSWCEHCVKARARNAHHRKKADRDPLDEVKVARVHMDYFFMSREDESACSNPLLVMADERSGARYARAVGKKGLGAGDEMDWLVRDISKTLKSWGHTGGPGGHLIFRSDGEPALMAVKTAVMQYHGGVCIPENPAQGEKAENGLIEESGKTIREYFCTFLSRIERGWTIRSPLTRI